MKLRVSSLIFVAMAVGLSSANADSLSQPFNESGVTGGFDQMDAFVFTPGGFSGPGMSGFTQEPSGTLGTTWNDSNVSSNWSQARGDALDSLNFNLNFDYTSAPVTIDFYAFLHGVMVDSASLSYTPGTSNYGFVVIDPMASGAGPANYANDQAAAAPEPMSLVLMSSGMIGLGLWGKKRRTRNKVLG